MWRITVVLAAEWLIVNGIVNNTSVYDPLRLFHAFSFFSCWKFLRRPHIPRRHSRASRLQPLIGASLRHIAGILPLNRQPSPARTADADTGTNNNGVVKAICFMEGTLFLLYLLFMFLHVFLKPAIFLRVLTLLKNKKRQTQTNWKRKALGCWTNAIICSVKVNVLDCISADVRPRIIILAFIRKYN